MKAHHCKLSALALIIGLTIGIGPAVSAQSGITGDFRNATRAEVADAQGRVVLTGTLALVEEEDDDVERKAVLTPTAVDPDAAGEAEVEYPRESAAQQEIEFSVRNLPSDSAVTFMLDGTVVGRSTTDRRGRAELEIEVPRQPATR